MDKARLTKQPAAPETSARSRLPPALRYRRFRAFWLGSMASVGGFHVLQFALFWLVHERTGSPLLLGTVGAAMAVPAIALNLFGGAMADKVDKRRLIIATQVAIAALIFLLGTLTLMDVVNEWHVIAIAFVSGAINAFDQPARMAIYPVLIERSAMTSAVALNSALWQGLRIPAPAIAGLLIAWTDTEGAFYLAGAGFVTMAVVMYFLDVPKEPGRTSGGSTLELMEGIRFIRANSVFSFLIGMSFFHGLFGVAYIVMMPVFAVDSLGLGAGGAGLLLGTSGVGALAANIWLGSRGGNRRQGPLVIGGATMSGISVAVFALTSYFIGSSVLAVALMLATGVFISVYMISLMSALQLMVPDHMRGRVMGFYGMTFAIMPLSGMQAGAIASVIGPPFGTPAAVAIGGLAVTAFALGPALFNRQIRGLRAVPLASRAADGDSSAPGRTSSEGG